MADEHLYSTSIGAQPLDSRCERCGTIIGDPGDGARNTTGTPVARSAYGSPADAARASQDDFRAGLGEQEGPTRPVPTRLLLTVEEAAKRLSVGRTLMYTLVMRHEVASIKVGRTRRIPVGALDEFVRQQIERAQAYTQTSSRSSKGGTV